MQGQTQALASNGELLLYALNALGVIFGFIASLLIKGLFDDLKTLKELVAVHREDMLKNYPSNNDLVELKDDIMERLDKAEHNIKNSLQASVFRNQLSHMQQPGGQQ